MDKKFADLHIHSFYSDGTMSPEEIIIKAKNNNVSIISVTDHDVLEGTMETIKLAGKYDIKCIPGVEIDTIHKGINYHILAYGIDLKSEEFASFIIKNRELLEEVNIKFINIIENDFEEVSLEDYLQFTYDKRKGGWKGLHYLIERGIIKNLYEAFRLYDKYEHTFDCVEFPSISEACAMIHEAGGKAIIAHPGKVIKEKDLDKFKIELIRAIEQGADGIECYHPSHSAEVIEICLQLCRNKDLLITCGSDCHGMFQKNEIGELNVDIDKLNLGDLL